MSDMATDQTEPDWRPLTLEERRALRSVKDLTEFYLSKPDDALELLKHLACVPMRHAYSTEAAFYFAMGYVQACLAIGGEKALAAGRLMLEAQLDYDKSGMKPADFFGVNRKYGKASK